MAVRAVDAVVESAPRRVFATAVDWPGWSRSGRDEPAALTALAAYAARYAPVAAQAGAAFPARVDADTITVAERLPGNATTGFGAPGVVSEHDCRPLSAAQARRMVALLRAAWATLDDVVRDAPAQLRKGPRGGGRDRDQILGHVLAAEVAYGRRIGLRLTDPGLDMSHARDNRDAIAAALEARSDGSAMVEPKGWPPRYAAARTAWHALDHAWEIQDRSGPA